MIDQIIAFNKTFVEQKGYEKYLTDKYPDKKLAVLSCMDTRLTELLPAALGLKNGDAKIIKNAGGLVISAFDSAMRSLIVAIYELGVEEIMVVAHSHCGACHMPMRHRPEPLVRGLQGHPDLRPQNRRDHPDAPARAEGRRGARVHHRFGDGGAGGDSLKTSLLPEQKSSYFVRIPPIISKTIQ